jgi:aspartate kinase
MNLTAAKKVLVQKFGGTSVATPVLRGKVINHIIQAREAGYRPVVVVSAMGRKGDPYATDTLLSLMNEVGGVPSAKERDLLISCGEVISTVILAQSLRAKGFPAIALSGMQAGVVTDDHFGNARIQEVRPQAVWQALDEGKIPVIAGFQGATSSGEITTLGRGGSDTTAAVFAVALKAELLEVYKDVEGVKTADPKVVPEASTLRRLTYSEVTQMAQLGAKVIHPRAVEVAMAAGIPIKIIQTGLNSPGTLITHDPVIEPGAIYRLDRPVTGIAHVSDRVYVNIYSPSDNPHLFNQVLEMLGEAGVSIDMIHLTCEKLTFIIGGEQTLEAEQVLNQVSLDHQIQPGFCKVSVVGGGMHGVPGIMARVFSSLLMANVKVFETTDSHSTISCLILQDDMAQAIKALHSEFDLDREPKESSEFMPGEKER